MKNIDLWKADEICNKHCIGLDQMGQVLARIFYKLTDENQSEILDKIGELADISGGSVEYIIKNLNV